MPEPRLGGRRRRRVRAVRSAVATALCLVSAAASAEDEAAASRTVPLSASALRGKLIYETGDSPAGPSIEATLVTAAGRLGLGGDAAACGGCHGHDGTGRPESGVVPSNVTWAALTRGDGHAHAGEIVHPPFDEPSLGRYLRTGRLPGGAVGDGSMPTYSIGDRDLADLVAYLRRLGTVGDPGVHADRIVVGTLVPADPALAEVAMSIRQVLEAALGEINATGGIYDRRLELVVHSVGAAGAEGIDGLMAWLEAARPFAIVSPFSPRADRASQAALSDAGVPVIGPFSLHSLRRFAQNRNVFYTYPGIAEQIAAAMVAARDRASPQSPRIAVLVPDDGSLDDLASAAERLARRRRWPGVRRQAFAAGRFDAAAVIDQMVPAEVDAVVAPLVESELAALLEAADRADWHPWVLAVGALAGGLPGHAPEPFADRLLIAYPTLPQDRRPWAVEALSRLIAESPAARRHPQAAIAARVSVAVLVEGLRRAGRDLGRHELVAALEAFYRFDTGLVSPITYTANRRVGARGAYVLSARDIRDRGFASGVSWIDVD